MPVERALQDGFQALVRKGLELHGALAGGFQPLLRVHLLQPQDAQTGAISHLGIGLFLQDGADHLGGCRPHAVGPMDQPRGRPLQMGLMAFGHVFGYRGVPVGGAAARMRSHALAVVKDSTGAAV